MRIRFLTATPMNVTAGSGTYTGIATLMRSLTSLGVEVKLETPRIHLPVFTAERLLFNHSIGASGAEVTVGFDLDGYRVARRGRAHVASIKGVIADEMRFESGATRFTMGIQARAERKHVRRAGLVLATSRYSAEKIREYYGEPRRMELVPEAIELDAWEQALERAAVRPEDGSFTVLSVGRFFPRKRTALLLRAAARLRDRLPALRVRLVGGGPEEARLRALHAELGLGERVVFLGSVPAAQLAEEFRNADLFCHSSVQEGFGIVYLEAMAAGKPIVAARAAAAPEVVPHAMLVEPDNDMALAAGIEAVAGAVAARERMRDEGRRIVRQYEARAVARQFLATVKAAFEL